MLSTSTARCQFLLLLCHLHDIVGRWNFLALNRRNSLPRTVMTFRQRSCNQRVCCLCSRMHNRMTRHFRRRFHSLAVLSNWSQPLLSSGDAEPSYHILNINLSKSFTGVISTLRCKRMICRSWSWRRPSHLMPKSNNYLHVDIISIEVTLNF